MKANKLKGLSTKTILGLVAATLILTVPLAGISYAQSKGSFANDSEPVVEEKTEGENETQVETTSSSVPLGENDVEKDEIVYARLDGEGQVNGIFVVNTFTPESKGIVVDYGSYSSIKNLTDTTELIHDGESVQMNVTDELFSYQGDLNTSNLPWNIVIEYRLNGRTLQADELAGKSGKLEIEIRTTQNKAVDDAFYENYMLQITVPFSENNARNIASDDGQIAISGSTVQISFTGMPGKDGVFNASATVQDFEMDGITFAAIPFGMFFDVDTDEFVEGFEELGDGVGELNDGASQLASGARELADGVNSLSSGASDLAGGTSDLASGLSVISSGVTTVANGLTTYQSALLEQAGSLEASLVGTSSEEAAYQNAMVTYVGAYAMIYSGAIAEGVSSEQAHGIAAQNTASQAAAVQSALEALITANATNAGNLGSAEALKGAAAGIGSVADGESLLGALNSLSSGMIELSSGADELSSGAKSLAAGTSELGSGSSSLASGAGELADGTSTLYTEIQEMPDAVQEEIDSMLEDYDKSDFEPVSFTSSKNTAVSLVQFVISTDSITIPDEEPEVEEVVDEGALARFLALFGL